jgi:hypothetical protein
MPSYKLSALASLDFSYRQAGINLSTKELAIPANAFVNNTDRVMSIFLFPIQLLVLSDNRTTR